MIPRHATIVGSLALCLAVVGCGEKPAEYQGPAPGTEAKAAASGADGEFNGKISELINQTSGKYRPLSYEFNEDLLAILDRVEARIAGKSPKLDPLPLPKLSEEEQLEHFKEVFKRWNADGKKNLRAEIDGFKAEVAARKPGGPVFHPEFQKKFAAVFDSLIPIEVTEMRERRNKALHAAAKPLFDEYRAKAPEAVKNGEATLNEGEYKLP